MCGGLRLVLRYLDRAEKTTRLSAKWLGDIAAAEKLLKMLAWLGMTWIKAFECVCVCVFSKFC